MVLYFNISADAYGDAISCRRGRGKEIDIQREREGTESSRKAWREGEGEKREHQREMVTRKGGEKETDQERGK